MKIAIINFSGNTGKSTLTKNLFVPLVRNAKRISIEDVNEGDGRADVEIGSRLFRNLAAELNVADDDQNFVLDIGSSVALPIMGHFSTLRTTRNDIDLWVTPVTPQLKQRADTLNTVTELLRIGVQPNRVVVVANNIPDAHSFRSDFEQISKAAKQEGFVMCPQAVLSNEVYEMTKGSNESVFDIVSKHRSDDLKAQRAALRHDPDKLEELGRLMVIRDSAEEAIENLKAVFEALPIALALTAA